MELTQEELNKLYKTASQWFIADYLESMIEFYRLERKTYAEEIKFIALLFDQAKDLNIEVTIKRVEAVKVLLKNNCVHETIEMLLASDWLKRQRKESYQRVLNLKHKIDTTMIPIFSYHEQSLVKQQEGHETYAFGNINFNIRALIEAIEKKPDDFELKEIKCETYFWKTCIPNQIDSSKNVDLSKPLIFLEISEGEYLCIDGRHRLYAAFQAQLSTLPAYHVKAGQILPFLLDQRSLKSFIHYWNRKLFKI